MARKKRIDAGVPRRRTLEEWLDYFADLSAPAQDAALAAVNAIHRQKRRGALPPAPEQLELAHSEETDGPSTNGN